MIFNTVSQFQYDFKLFNTISSTISTQHLYKMISRGEKPEIFIFNHKHKYAYSTTIKSEK